MDHINKQLKEFLKFKDEIMDELEEFMDDVETQSIVADSEQFDDVVDIIANEQRERGEQIVELQENGMTQDSASEAA